MRVLSHSYTNEMGHIQTKHPDFMEVMKHETRQQTLTFVPTQDAKDLHLWMITIIIEYREFSMVESPFMRLLANHRKHYSTETGLNLTTTWLVRCMP